MSNRLPWHLEWWAVPAVVAAVVAILVGAMIAGARYQEAYGINKCPAPVECPPAVACEAVPVATPADIEAAHVRIDKLIEAVAAIAPEVPGRMRAPILLNEARRQVK